MFSFLLQPHVGPSCCCKGPGASEQWEWEQNTESGAVGRGPAASVGLRCRVHSESSCCSWLDYKTFLDLSFPRQGTDIGQISLFFPRPFPRGMVSGTVSKCVGGVHTWPRPAVKVHAFMTPVILPSGSGLGVCKKAIILRKTWKMFFIIVDTSSTQLLDICCFSRCYYYEISQGCECTLLEIPTTVVCSSMRNH